MAADEEQPQDVVAVVFAVEPVGERGFGVAEIGEFRLVGQFGVAGALADIVHRRIAPDQDQPSGGVAWRAVLRPCPEGPQAGFLKSFLGRIEVTEVAQQRSHHLGADAGDDRVDPAEVVHAAGFFSVGRWLS